MAIFIYSRVSTKEQNAEQTTKVLMKDFPEAKIFEEKQSGKSFDRPIWIELYSQMNKGDTLVVYDLSRLGRNTIEFLELLEDFNAKGLHLVIHNMSGLGTVDTRSPMGKMMLTFNMGIQQMNREVMLEKQKIGIARAKKEGKYQGKQVSEDTIRAVKKAMKLIQENGLGVRDAAKASGIGSATLYRYIKAQKEVV